MLVGVAAQTPEQLEAIAKGDLTALEGLVPADELAAAQAEMDKAAEAAKAAGPWKGF